MLLKICIGYLMGFVRIKVESFYLERFINICLSKNIMLWNIKRNGSSILNASIGINDYKKLKDIARKTKSHIKIEEKKGFPFFMYKHKKREFFFILLIIIGILLITVSNFIWNIEIKGNEKISSEEIAELLKNSGLKIGMYKRKIDLDTTINTVRINKPDIAWIGIKLVGTNAIVEIKEAKEKPQIIDQNEYCNIISDKEGIITKINVQNGTANVKEGDSVKPRDILVLGYLEGKYTGKRFVHSIADIEAKIYYSKKEKFYYNEQIKVPTTATEKKYTIKFNNFKINLYKTLSKFQNYDTIRENKKISLFFNFYLPIEIIKTTNYEYEEKEVMFTEEQLIDNGTKKLVEEVLKEIQNKEGIVNKQVNTYKYEDGIEVEVIYEVLENIGIEDKIIF